LATIDDVTVTITLEEETKRLLERLARLLERENRGWIPGTLPRIPETEPYPRYPQVWCGIVATSDGQTTWNM
jgi:hypothetical protein